MVLSDALLTKIRMEVPHGVAINRESFKNGAIASVFDASGNLLHKPCELAEALHPGDIWFKLDISHGNFREGLKEMGKLLHMGFSNFGILLSGLKDIKDLHKVRLAAAECGVSFGIHIPFGVVIDHPGMALSYDSISNAGASFAVIDMDVLSKKIMCSEIRQDTIPDPVLKIVAKSIEHFKDNRVHVSAQGKMLDNASVLNELVKHGVDSIIAHPENAEKIKMKTSYAEKMCELNYIKSKMKGHLKPQ